MTAASSTDQALIHICSFAGNGATSARLATAAPTPTPVGQRRASGPRERLPGDGTWAGFAAGCCTRRRPPSEVERQRGQLRAGGHGELAEHVAQVEVDGAG